MPTYPSNPDYWTEITTTPPGGHWIPLDYTIIEIDFIHKMVGAASIYVKTNAPLTNPYSGATFIIDDGLEFDGTRLNAQVKFKLDLRTGLWPGLTGLCTIRLGDNSGGIVEIAFNQTPNDQFIDQSFMLGETQGWNHLTKTFDWTKIKTITIICEMAVTYPAQFCSSELNIDMLHFSFDLSQAALNVLAEDKDGNVVIGKRMQLVTPNGATQAWDVPFHSVGVSPGKYTITILDSDFIKWKDDVAGATREVMVSTQPVTVTAVFTSGQPPPNGGDNTVLIAGGIGLGVAAVILYYMTRGKSMKRRRKR